MRKIWPKLDPKVQKKKIITFLTTHTRCYKKVYFIKILVIINI